MRLLINILVSGLAVLVTAKLLPGIRVSGYGDAVVVAVVLGVVNALLWPLLLILTLPINLLTLGLFTFVIMGGLVELVALLVPGFQVANFWWALAFALVMSLINSFLHAL